MQIKVYAAAGGKPHTWDSQQKASVYYMKTGPHYALYNIMVVDTIQRSGIVGCFILSIAMAVVIPHLVLGYHNSLVSRATTPGTRSIYWGTAAICWLLSITIITLSKTTTYYACIRYNIYRELYPKNISCFSSFAFHVVILIEFLIISLIAARSNKLKTIPIPAARFTSNVLFCCCCCLYCCSSQRRARGVQAMVLWGFMTFCISRSWRLLLFYLFSLSLYHSLYHSS